MKGGELIDIIKNLGAEEADIKIVLTLTGGIDMIQLLGDELQIEVKRVSDASHR